MADWQVALVQQQGIDFAVVLVQDHVVESPTERSNVINWWAAELGRPVVVLGERRFRSFGRPDIVRWLGNVHPSRLPWRRMTVAA